MVVQQTLTLSIHVQSVLSLPKKKTTQNNRKQPNSTQNNLNDNDNVNVNVNDNYLCTTNVVLAESDYSNLPPSEKTKKRSEMNG